MIRQYLNLVVGLDDDPGPNGDYANFAGEQNRVHTIPYIVDTVGPVVGLRLHYPNVLSYGTVVQSNLVAPHGLTLGTADGGFTRRYEVDEKTLPSKLGIGLRWEPEDGGARHMRSSVLRGMPYGTVEYSPGVVPTIASEIVADAPLVDGAERLPCGALDPDGDGILAQSARTLVKKDVELSFPESDFTWLVFFSRSVFARCYVNEKKLKGTVSLPPGAEPPSANRNAFQLRLDPATTPDDGGVDATEEEGPLVVRIALANNCTRGINVNFCDGGKPRDQSSFTAVLREHASVYPTSPSVKYIFSEPVRGFAPEAPEGESTYLFFDWAAESFDKHERNDRDEAERELIMFALPHHVDVLRGVDGGSSNEAIGHCARSLHGNVCLVRGGMWAMEEGEASKAILLHGPADASVAPNIVGHCEARHENARR